MGEQKDEVQLKVALYIRVSTEDQKEKYGPDLQLSALKALVESRVRLSDGRPSMVLAGERYIYRDEGISGTTVVEARPGFARLKEDLLNAPEGQKPFDVVAVYKIDRLARRLKILLDIIDFFQNNSIQFISANESIDTSTPFGKAILAIIGTIAELELETIKQRTQAGREEAAKRGVFMGAGAPYGYKKTPDKTLEVFEDEAKYVRLIFEKFVDEHWTMQQIATHLTKIEVPSPDASAVINKKRAGEVKKKNTLFLWRSTTIRDILQNEIYIGKLYYNKSKGEIRLPQSDWKLSNYNAPNLIDLFTFHKAQELLPQAKALANARRNLDKHVYLLSNLLKCDHCLNFDSQDANMMTWTGSKKLIGKDQSDEHYTYFYMCGRKNHTKFSTVCNTLPIPAEPIEKYVLDLTKELLDNPLAVFNYQLHLRSTQNEIEKLRRDREEIKKLLNKLPDRADRLKEQHEMGVIDRSSLYTKLGDLDTSKRQYEDHLQEIEYKIGQNTISQGYVDTIKLFSGKYKLALKDIYEDREQIFEIFHLLIDKIIVFSRPVTPKDKIAGKKKETQFIPNKLEIQLKLPQEMLQELVRRFQSKNVDL